MSTDIDSQLVTQSASRRTTVRDVQKTVAKAYEMSVEMLLLRTRRRAICYPRQIAMYLATKLTSVSLPDIGHRFGGFDHTTVMHARDRIMKLMETDQRLRQEVVVLERAIQAK